MDEPNPYEAPRTRSREVRPRMPREVRIPWVLSWVAVLLFVAHFLLAVFWPVYPGRRSGVFFVCLAAAQVLTGAGALGGAFVVAVVRGVRAGPGPYEDPHVGAMAGSFWRGVAIAIIMSAALVSSD